MSFLENLNWRYATKKFDANKKVEEEKIQKIRDAIRLAPTSLGVQMFSVVEVENQEIKEKLKETAFGQPQIVDADRVFVFNARLDSENRIENMFSNMSGGDTEVRNTALAQYEGMVKGFVSNLDRDGLFTWSTKNAAIALGFALAAAAELNVDSCPMDGFNPSSAKEVLGLSDDFMPVAILTLGYRDDSDEAQNRSKWRFEEKDIFLKI